MIHLETLQEIQENKLKDGFLLPYYEKYSIAELVPSVLSAFGIQTSRSIFPPNIFSLFSGAEKIVVFMFDGFGFDYLQNHYKDFAFFAKMEKHGHIFPITTVFPSTTPAALTTLHSGLTPQEHGLPEWFVYFEELDTIVETIPFKKMGEPERDNLLKLGGTTQMLFNDRTAYEQLKEHSVKSFVFTYHEYSGSVYSTSTQKGSTVVPYANARDLAHKLHEAVNQTPGKAYFFVYWSQIDEIEHAFGPGSAEHHRAVEDISKIMEEEFFPNIKKSAAKNCICLLTADHGQANVTKEKIIYLNDYLELEKNYKWGKTKKSILPTGAPHDVFLHIHEPAVEKIIEILESRLGDKAEVLTTKEALEAGLFGVNKPINQFLSRIGNVLILPHKNFHVWYRHFQDKPYSLKGTHGGLSPDEMLVPLAICPLPELL